MIIDKNSPIPQYFQLQTWLIEQIEHGVFKPDDKIPTEEEIVHITGLARATIRQAIQNLVNMGYLVRKRRLGTFVLQQTIDDHKRPIIGMLVPDIRAGYAPEVARGAEDEAAKSKHSLILCNTDDLYIKADFHADRLIEQNVSGVIFVPTAATDERNRQIVDKFRNNGILVVLADRHISNLEIDLVTTDNFEGAYKATQYLVQQGHTQIAVILSTLFSTERKRLEGYRKALSDHGISEDPDIVLATNDPFIEEKYYRYVRSLLSNHVSFTALFAGHDRIAYIVESVAGEIGLHIPEDIALIGYDDLNLMYPLPVPLTTMHQPIYEMGQESMRVIIERMGGKTGDPEEHVLQSYLVERESAAPPRKA